MTSEKYSRQMGSSFEANNKVIFKMIAGNCSRDAGQFTNCFFPSFNQRSSYVWEMASDREFAPNEQPNSDGVKVFPSVITLSGGEIIKPRVIGVRHPSRFNPTKERLYLQKNSDVMAGQRRWSEA
jgi:hypothetical protein